MSRTVKAASQSLARLVGVANLIPNICRHQTAVITRARHLMSDEIRINGRIWFGHIIRIESPQGVEVHTAGFGVALEVKP